MIDLGERDQEGLRMSGIEEIMQGLEIELNNKVNAQHDLATRQAELSRDIETLQVMIAAGTQQLNGCPGGVNVAPHAWEPPSTRNPFREKTIKWYCFEAFNGVEGEIHTDDVWKAVKKHRRCARSTVSNTLHENGAYFTRGAAGWFSRAEP
jgi:hypothetical protein